MSGAPVIPLALFWIGWTSRPSILMWCPLNAGVACGFGIYCLSISSCQHIAPAFENCTTSVLASLQMFRLVAEGVMAILADIMCRNLGAGWIMTLLGGLWFN